MGRPLQARGPRSCPEEALGPFPGSAALPSGARMGEGGAWLTPKAPGFLEGMESH